MKKISVLNKKKLLEILVFFLYLIFVFRWFNIHIGFSKYLSFYMKLRKTYSTITQSVKDKHGRKYWLTKARKTVR